MNNKVPLIYQGVLKYNNLLGIPDLLKKLPDQSSYKGRLAHAAAQARYRASQNKVTDQGSPERSLHDLLPNNTNTPQVWISGCCHFCGRACEAVVRRGFLRRRTRFLARNFTYGDTF